MSSRRERDDKISKIMGSYLLKGHTLLDAYCNICETPLMKSRTGDVHCIACQEVGSIHENRGKGDSAIIKTDDQLSLNSMCVPAESVSDANSHTSLNVNPSTLSSDDEPESVGCKDSETYNVHQHHKPTATISSAVKGDNNDSGISMRPTFSGTDTQFIQDVRSTKVAIQRKLRWATEKLDTCSTISSCIQLCTLIKACADTLQSLKNLDPNNG